MAANLIAGNALSKTNWAGLTIAVLGYLQLPAVHESLLPWAKEEHLAAATSLMGLLIVVIRNMTTESVAAKGQRFLEAP